MAARCGLRSWPRSHAHAQSAVGTRCVSISAASARAPAGGTKAVAFAPRALPAIPDGTFIVAAENDQFGTAEELRAAVPHARIATVSDVDHFFVGKRDEVGTLVADELARVLPVPSHLP